MSKEKNLDLFEIDLRKKFKSYVYGFKILLIHLVRATQSMLYPWKSNTIIGF